MSSKIEALAQLLTFSVPTPDLSLGITTSPSEQVLTVSIPSSNTYVYIMEGRATGKSIQYPAIAKEIEYSLPGKSIY
jgi:hypothetical protein